MDTIQPKSADLFQSLDLNVESAKASLKELTVKKYWTDAKNFIGHYDISKINDVEFLTMIADVYTNTDDYPAALKTFHQALDESDGKDPNLFEIYKNMGNLYLKCGDVEAAEEKYNQANAIDSQDENLMINYGVLAIQKGQYTDAKGRFADVLKINDQSDLAWVGLGLVHRAHADHDLARACLLRGLDENPYNKLAITNYYQWCYQDGVDSSDKFLNDFLEKYPEDSEISKMASGLHQ